jgi:hypothetical protein
MSIRVGSRVDHPDHGRGVIKEILGGQAIVEFYGERVNVQIGKLSDEDTDEPAPIRTDASLDIGRIMFRRALEAINLGVVPPHPDQLLTLAIGGSERVRQLGGWLRDAKDKGLCKVFFGDYGSGKSHQLRTLEALARKNGWVVSYVEFDPKEADPAKPHLVYRAIISGLRFPPRDDGSTVVGFDGFVKEVRDHWPRTSQGRHFRASPWFWNAFSLLRNFPHSDDWEYRKTCAWLGGQPIPLSDVKRLATRTGRRAEMPQKMPRTLETSDIYVSHLAVLNELCQLLEYKGLLLILDEAEHVRGYSTKRQERANNLFELLSRCAHLPVTSDPPPIRNDHGFVLSPFWTEGPHFALAVGLTEGDTFSDPEVPAREACAFLHSDDDADFLKPPEPDDYKEWLGKFLDLVHSHYGSAELLASPENRRLLAETLAIEFSRVDPRERVMRLWVKLGCLVPCIILAGAAQDIEDVRSLTAKAARQVAGRILPWEE